MTDQPENKAASRTRNAVENAVESARDKAYEQAEAATDTATQEAGARVSNAADAAAAAGSEFEPGSLQAQAADHVATQLQSVAQTIRQTDFDTAIRRTTYFARENPVLFLGGAALLGFAAARFLKASDPATAGHNTVADSDPWTGHVTSTGPSQPMSAPTAAQPTAYSNGRTAG